MADGDDKNIEIDLLAYSELLLKSDNLHLPDGNEGTAGASKIIKYSKHFQRKHDRQKNFHPKGVTQEKIIFWKKCRDEINARRPDIKSKAELARRIEKKCVGEFAKYHNAIRTIRDNI